MFSPFLPHPAPTGAAKGCTRAHHFLLRLMPLGRNELVVTACGPYNHPLSYKSSSRLPRSSELPSLQPLALLLASALAWALALALASAPGSAYPSALALASAPRSAYPSALAS